MVERKSLERHFNLISLARLRPIRGEQPLIRVHGARERSTVSGGKTSLEVLRITDSLAFCRLNCVYPIRYFIRIPAVTMRTLEHPRCHTCSVSCSSSSQVTYCRTDRYNRDSAVLLFKQRKICEDPRKGDKDRNRSCGFSRSTSESSGGVTQEFTVPQPSAVKSGTWAENRAFSLIHSDSAVVATI